MNPLLKNILKAVVIDVVASAVVATFSLVRERRRVREEKENAERMKDFSKKLDKIVKDAIQPLEMATFKDLMSIEATEFIFDEAFHDQQYRIIGRFANLLGMPAKALFPTQGHGYIKNCWARTIDPKGLVAVVKVDEVEVTQVFYTVSVSSKTMISCHLKDQTKCPEVVVTKERFEELMK